VRRVYNDISFIDEFVDEEFAERQKLYVYGFDQATGQYEIVDRDYTKVKSQLLEALTNFGNPIIYVVDATTRIAASSTSIHEWAGKDLQFDQALQTLKAVARRCGSARCTSRRARAVKAVCCRSTARRRPSRRSPGRSVPKTSSAPHRTRKAPSRGADLPAWLFSLSAQQVDRCRRRVAADGLCSHARCGSG
jgi:uncharacterized low-complexity protein